MDYIPLMTNTTSSFDPTPLVCVNCGHEHHYEDTTVRDHDGSILCEDVAACEARGFVVEARCPEDGMIEAIRRVEGPYMAAVQWHPEFHDPADTGTFDDTPMLEDFLAACRAARQETAR